jgi:hypothetical protein
MAAKLSVQQKRKLYEHRSELEKDGQKFPYKDQLGYCEKNVNQSPSSSAISRIWEDREKWYGVKDDHKAKQIRGAKWPDLEKALVLWITQVQSCPYQLRSCPLLTILLIC